MKYLVGTERQHDTGIVQTKKKSKQTSYSENFTVSVRFMSSTLGGLSRVASARQRSVSRPVPYSRMVDSTVSLMAWLRGTLLLPTRTCVHRSITPSGAPYGNMVISDTASAFSIVILNTVQNSGTLFRDLLTTANLYDLTLYDHILLHVTTKKGSIIMSFTMQRKCA